MTVAARTVGGHPARPTEEQERGCHVRIGHRWMRSDYDHRMLVCVDCQRRCYRHGYGGGVSYEQAYGQPFLYLRPPCPAQVRR